MKKSMVRVGQRVVNLLAIKNARRDGEKLWLNFIGGGFEVFDHEEAEAIWQLVLELAADLALSDQK